jgi:hypothetical protein
MLLVVRGWKNEVSIRYSFYKISRLSVLQVHGYLSGARGKSFITYQSIIISSQSYAQNQ